MSDNRLDSRLAAIVTQKLPARILREDPDFVRFVQAFYDHQQEPGQWLDYLNRAKRNLDIDYADESVLDNMLDEFAQNFPRINQIPKNQLLKIMRSFNLSRGSEESFEFLFRVLYDEEITLEYPREVMYEASNGRYANELILNISGENAFKLTIDNTDLAASLTGNTSGAQAVIDTIQTTFLGGNSIMSLEISSFNGSFIPGEVVLLTVNGVSVEATAFGSVSSITIDDGGTGYLVTDDVTITDTLTGTLALAQITNVSRGGMDTPTITNMGVNYAEGDEIRLAVASGSIGYGFRAIVAEVDLLGGIVSVIITATGYDYNQVMFGVVSSVAGTGAVVEFIGENVGRIREIEVFDGGIGYVSDATITVSITSPTGTGAVVSPVVGVLFNQPRRYLDDKSQPSGNAKIQDSDFYSNNSYVIGSGISPSLWLDQIRRVGNPAGSKLFGLFRLDIDAHIDITTPTSATIIVTI